MALTLDVSQYTPQESGKPLYIQEWKLSDDLKYLLVKTDYRKVSSTPRQLMREFITYPC
jgi:hypothetical protein